MLFHKAAQRKRKPESDGLWSAGVAFIRPSLPISLFRSLVVQLWKNSVIRLSSARNDASSEA